MPLRFRIKPTATFKELTYIVEEEVSFLWFWKRWVFVAYVPANQYHEAKKHLKKGYRYIEEEADTN